jgi:hypothetical protein
MNTLEIVSIASFILSAEAALLGTAWKLGQTVSALKTQVADLATWLKDVSDSRKTLDCPAHAALIAELKARVSGVDRRVELLEHPELVRAASSN